MAVSYRTNLTMRQLAPPFGVSPATVYRMIQRLVPLLALEPARAPQDMGRYFLAVASRVRR